MINLIFVLVTICVICSNHFVSFDNRTNHFWCGDARSIGFTWKGSKLWLEIIKTGCCWDWGYASCLMDKRNPFVSFFCLRNRRARTAFWFECKIRGERCCFSQSISLSVLQIWHTHTHKTSIQTKRIAFV